MTEEIKAGQIIEYDKDNTPHFIIDGVDVSECRLRMYNSDLCNGFKMDNSGFHQGHCKQNPNCYYKQLKRLETENAKLKKENEILQTSLEMIKNTEGQAHIKAIELTKKLGKIKEVINECMKFKMCKSCKFYKECDKNMEEYIIKIIEGAENE